MGREAGEFQESHLGVAFLGEITGRIWVVSWQEDVEGTGRGQMEAALWIVGGSMLTCVPRRLVIALVWTKARSPCAGPWRNVTCSRPTRLRPRPVCLHALGSVAVARVRRRFVLAWRQAGVCQASASGYRPG